MFTPVPDVPPEARRQAYWGPIIDEFLAAGHQAALIDLCGLPAETVRVGLAQSARRKHSPVRVSLRGDRVYLSRKD